MPPFSSSPRWSIVIPYYNEERYIERTLRCALAQAGGPAHVVLVNNASDDHSEALCRALIAAAGVTADFVYEAKPGPSHALEAGLAAVRTPLVALWNADTWYPADYLRRAEALLEDEAIVAAMAVDIYDPPASWPGWIARVHKRNMSLLWPRQTHTGTYGQCFRTDVLRAAGGPRSDAWPWVLDDHELMQRVFKLGRARYHADFWCMPSARRCRTAHVRWTLFERVLYHATPYALKDWFFYSFLDARFRARGMRNRNLRDRDWSDEHAAPDARPAEWAFD